MEQIKKMFESVKVTSKVANKALTLIYSLILNIIIKEINKTKWNITLCKNKQLSTLKRKIVGKK